MAAHTRIRSLMIAAAAAALLAPLVAAVTVASPASAAVGPRPHEVYMYKVEQHVDLSGEFPDNTGETYLSCNNGDYALDGMWRVDHVDQANPQLDQYGDERDVVFHASYSNTKSQWYFRYENYADGNAQVKLFVTCIRKQTESNVGHQHGIDLTDPFGYPHHGLLAGTYQAGFDHAAACAPGYSAVAPGFNFPNNERSRMIGSYPTPDFRGWQWGFVVNSDNTDLDVAFRCLSNRVLAATGHRHELMMKWRPNADPYWGFDDHTWSNGIQEKRLSCDDGANGSAYQDYKAMVGAFWIYDWQHVWYLGMDPRPKTRAFSFWDQGGGGHVLYNVFCVKSRTGKQISPSA